MTPAATRVLSWAMAMLCLVCSFSIDAQDTWPLRIAVVDLERVVTDSQAGREANDRLEAFNNRAKNELTPMSQDMEALRQRLIRLREGHRGTIPEDEAELRRQLMEAHANFQRRSGELSNELLRRSSEEENTLRAQFMPIIQQLQAELEIDLMVDEKGIVLHASDRVDIHQEALSASGGVDITQEVIRRFDGSYRR